MERGDERPYHHGNLRRELLDAAAAAIEEQGVAQLSLRGLAQRAGVSHSAPAHHFGDKRGLLTAIAAEGYRLLGDELAAAAAAGDFLEAALGYVRFATDHPAHFQVMFQPQLHRAGDPDLAAARARTDGQLAGTASARAGEGAPDDDRRRVAVAGWCLVHGLSTLWLAGNLRADGDDPVELARRIALAAFADRR